MTQRWTDDYDGPGEDIRAAVALSEAEYAGTGYASDPVADLIDALGEPHPAAPRAPVPEQDDPYDLAAPDCMPCRRIMTAAEIAADEWLWLEERRRGDNGRDGARTGGWRLTASEMAAAMGLAPPQQGSAYSLYHAKLDGVSTFAGDERTDLGLYLENLTAGRFADSDWAEGGVLGPGGLYVSTRYPWLGATFDRILWNVVAEDCDTGQPIGFVPSAPVQLKSWAARRDFGDDGDGIMPVHLRVQLLTEMIVLGTDWAAEPVTLLPSGKLVIAIIERDADAERDMAAIIAAGEEMIRWLDEEQDPPVDWTPATTATLKALYQRIDPDASVRVTARLGHRYHAARRAVAAAEKRLAQAQNEIRSHAGNAKTITARNPVTKAVETVARRTGYPRAGYSVPPNEWVEVMNPGAWTWPE